MKRTIIVISLLVFLIPCQGWAISIFEPGIVYDDLNDQYWIQDLSKFTNLTYSEQLSAIGGLNASSDYIDDRWGDWRMASLVDWDNIRSQIDLDTLPSILTFFSPSDSGTDLFYVGRVDFLLGGGTRTPAEEFVGRSLVGGGYEWLWHPSEALTDRAYESIGAWVVADADSSPIPEPSTILLLCAGLTGFAYKRKRS